MKLGQLIRMSGLALALASGFAGCDDDEGPSGADGGPDAMTGSDARTDVPGLDAADGGAGDTRPGGDGGDARPDGGDALETGADATDATAG